MSAMSNLDILFQELRHAIQNNESSEQIRRRYLAVTSEFPQLTMGDVVYEFELWLKAKEEAERNEARKFVSDHFKIISVM